ncbi:MarR family winged helix-turn-helix transcriptional regulator [Nocardioides pelophilus]|uniref:MarR family winged helix-turn-helix transcriptional regulator n=1 Tax=Nocardioides pelophilus TaxID=2172019 RepID=UPI0028AF97C5|nr:MarR family transcriptional regulator [Nocardioides pelophilus]
MPELNLGLLLFIPYRAMETAVVADLARHGHHLSIAQARVFQRIGPDGIRPSELAEATQLTKQTLGSILDQLEKAGYVARTPDPADGRARVVTITRRGQELVDLSLPVVEEMERAWTEHLGPERTRQLREVLVDLREITDPFLD